MAFSQKQNEILKPGENAPHPDRFVRRHIGPRPEEAGEILEQLGYIAYTFTHTLFDHIVSLGNLK
jgi:hypothetical protein